MLWIICVVLGQSTHIIPQLGFPQEVQTSHEQKLTPTVPTLN